MKKMILVAIFLGFIKLALGQNQVIDSLKQQLVLANSDSAKIRALYYIGDYYAFVQFDSSIFYANQTIDLSNQLNNPFGKFAGLRCIFHAYNCQGNFPKALEAVLSMQKIVVQPNNTSQIEIIVGTHYFLGVLYREMGNFPKAIALQRQAIQENQAAGKSMDNISFAYSQLAIIYLKRNQIDSALVNAEKGYKLGLQSKKYKEYLSLAMAALGSIYVEKGNYKLAEDYFLLGIQHSKRYNNIYFEIRNYNLLASLFNKTGYQDSCIYYAGISLQLSQQNNFSEFKEDAAQLLAQVYELQNKPDSALKYLHIELVAKDSVFSPSKVQDFQKTDFIYQSQQQELQQKLQQAELLYKNRLKEYLLLAGIILLLLVAGGLWRRNIYKQKSFVLVQKQKEEIQSTLTQLKSTQSQLIQSEKMASLGELTAGIAHEIQNPLNFVNNFSEVNTEMLQEMKEEMDNGNIMQAKSIANEIISNEQKISQHGKRADAIVKGMLQHSQSTTGQKAPTNINVLADEYLRLSYHGLRAKDKNFNSTMQTNFDERIKEINIIPQDIGRVLLNLYNNAFYATSEKKKAHLEGYEPTVSVTTEKAGAKIVIKVRDNGPGIPQKVVDKIFQPFFTTKPTGQGTGLGLSISYDIVKKHGGELNVETEEGVGSTFKIILPDSIT